MQATSIKTCFVRGVVSTASWNVGNGETWSRYPSDVVGSAVVNYSGGSSIGCFSGCNNITFYGLAVNGGTASVPLFSINASNHIYFDDDILDATVTQAISAYNNDYFYIRGSTINGLVNSGWDSVSLPMNDNLSHSHIFNTDNYYHICGRFCAEEQSLPGNSGTFTYVYNDRDTYDGFEGTHGTCAAGSPTFGAVSFVYGPGSNNSVQGNTYTIPSNANTCSIGSELIMGGATVQNNTYNYVPVAIQCCGASGGQYAGAGQYFNSNTINVPITNTVIAAQGGLVAFGKDGLFSTPVQFTIGTNLIVGSSSNSVVGCTNSAGTPPGYCNLGTNTFPPTPPITPPSPVWTQ